MRGYSRTVRTYALSSLGPLSAALVVMAGCAVRAAEPPSTATVRSASPRVFALRAEELAQARALVRAGSPSILPAFQRLKREADEALRAPLVAVTHKSTLLPPSDNKHDYFSLSPYWWPDSSKPNGLPYIRRDGQTNPESKRDLDQPRVAALGWNLQTLALAYYFSGDEAYARRAAEQLRTWFLDTATRMTPHLHFAQLVRGIDRERGSGIIDTRWFIETVDAVGLIEGSSAWAAEDTRRLQEWFRSYLTWLRTSPNGAHERVARNNHGSWFAAQTASYALFAGDTALAREIIAEAKGRIGWQFTPDGQQPIELERTRSMHYSGFNIEALSRVAEMGRQLGIDLWNYQAPEGGSLRKGIDHLARYIVDPSKWPGQQIDPVSLDLLIIHLRRAHTVFGDPSYLQILERLPGDAVRTDRSTLLYPDPSR
jgi:Alginate lyase